MAPSKFTFGRLELSPGRSKEEYPPGYTDGYMASDEDEPSARQNGQPRTEQDGQPLSAAQIAQCKRRAAERQAQEARELELQRLADLELQTREMKQELALLKKERETVHEIWAELESLRAAKSHEGPVEPSGTEATNGLQEEEPAINDEENQAVSGETDLSRDIAKLIQGMQAVLARSPASGGPSRVDRGGAESQYRVVTHVLKGKLHP
jgi:hypothetical protein